MRIEGDQVVLEGDLDVIRDARPDAGPGGVGVGAHSLVEDEGFVSVTRLRRRVGSQGMGAAYVVVVVPVGADAVGRPIAGLRERGGDQPVAAAVDVEVDLHRVRGEAVRGRRLLKEEGDVDPGRDEAEFPSNQIEVRLIVHHLCGEGPLEEAPVIVVGEGTALRGQKEG
jgi:hypothetical protein